MSERLLTLDEVPDRGAWLVVGNQQTAILLPDEVPIISAELDRLYAADEATQAPGPDWKAKLRREVEVMDPGPVSSISADSMRATAVGATVQRVLALIDALPDPPTPTLMLPRCTCPRKGMRRRCWDETCPTDPSRWPSRSTT